MPQIYSAICAAMADIGAITKDKKNQSFRYRGIDDVMNALQPVLIKHHIFLVPEVIEEHREERTTKSGGNMIYTILKVRYHFFADDGSEVCATVQGEGMDNSDKSGNKAMSIAFKYACFQVFCIPTEEMQDPDAGLPAQSTSTTPATEEQLSRMRAAILKYSKMRSIPTESVIESLENALETKLTQVTGEQAGCAVGIITQWASQAGGTSHAQ